MSGNDFEKQVQQKMDELKFAPSDAIWPAVEKQIAERKKRRALFIWLPLLLLLLGGTAWLYNTGTKRATTRKYFPVANGHNQQVAEAVISQPQQIKQTAIEKESLYDKTITNKEIALSKNSKEPGQKRSDDNKVAAVTATPRHDNAVSHTAKSKYTIPAGQKNSGKMHIASQGRITSWIPVHNNTHGQNTTAVRKEGGYAGVQLKEAAEIQTIRKAKNKKDQPEKVTAIEEDALAATITAAQKARDGYIKGRDAHESMNATETPEAPATAATSKAPVNAKVLPADSIKNTAKADSAGAMSTSKTSGKKIKRIEWGIAVSAGASNISQGFWSVLSATSAYDATAYANNLNNSPVTVNNGSNNSSGPSVVKPGHAFAANIFISKRLTKKLQLRAGIGYSYFSSRIEVGAKIDSNKALEQYNLRSNSASSVTNNYTNRFHFICLPVTLEQQIGKAGHFSVNGGLALSWMAGSNALLYDKTKRIYYKDNSQLNKVQLGLLAGFNYRMFLKSFLIEAGPQVDYGLSRIFKKELYGSRYLFFGGIHTSILFCKKKQ